MSQEFESSRSRDRGSARSEREENTCSPLLRLDSFGLPCKPGGETTQGGTGSRRVEPTRESAGSETRRRTAANDSETTTTTSRAASVRNREAAADTTTSRRTANQPVEREETSSTSRRTTRRALNDEPAQNTRETTRSTRESAPAARAEAVTRETTTRTARARQESRPQEDSGGSGNMFSGLARSARNVGRRLGGNDTLRQVGEDIAIASNSPAARGVAGRRGGTLSDIGNAARLGVTAADAAEQISQSSNRTSRSTRSNAREETREEVPGSRNRQTNDEWGAESSGGNSSGNSSGNSGGKMSSLKRGLGKGLGFMNENPAMQTAGRFFFPLGAAQTAASIVENRRQRNRGDADDTVAEVARDSIRRSSSGSDLNRILANSSITSHVLTFATGDRSVIDSQTIDEMMPTLQEKVRAKELRVLDLRGADIGCQSIDKIKRDLGIEVRSDCR